MPAGQKSYSAITLSEFRIAYTFGVAPLQQYLIEFEDGRLQGLQIAWNIPDKRWFHLYPDEVIPHTDLLHWTGREQNWNSLTLIRDEIERDMRLMGCRSVRELDQSMLAFR